MPVVAKFRVSSRKEEDRGQIFYSADLVPVQAKEGEDSVFGKYTPNGKAYLGGLREGSFKILAPGSCYYLKFQLVPDPALADAAIAVLTFRVTSLAVYKGQVTVGLNFTKDHVPDNFFGTYPSALIEMTITNEAAYSQFKIDEAVNVYVIAASK